MFRISTIPLIISLSLTTMAINAAEPQPISTLASLKEKFSTEPEGVRAFRARGMLNRYYSMRRLNSPKATAYLATIVYLFPEVERVQLEWRFALQRKEALGNLKIQKPTPIIIKKVGKTHYRCSKIKSAPTENEMMDNYYSLKKTNRYHSITLLKKINNQFPNNFDAQTEMGYYLLQQHKQREALSYFLKAQKIKPHDFIIANQIGFIENNLELNKEAYQQFNNATHSPDNITSSQAEVALVNLSNWRYKYLPDPWYFEFYTEPYYTSRFTDYIAPLEARLGAALGRYKQFMVYLSYKQSTDTQSTGSGTAPQIYNDNAGVIAAGARIFPYPMFLGFYAEYGTAYNIGNQTIYPPWEQDFRGGSSYSGQWGAPAAYASKFVVECKPWTDVYSNVGYYSRYENWIGQARQRFGVRVFRWRHTTLSPYLMGQYFFDSQHLYYNNLIEFGPGISLQPYNLINFSVSYEHLFGYYIPTQDSSNNPYGSHYQTNIVRAQFFIRI